MKNLALVAIILLLAFSCGTTQKTVETDKSPAQVGDTIKIASEESEYDIIIIEPGFNVWLNTTARPEGFYNQTYLENKNIFFMCKLGIVVYYNLSVTIQICTKCKLITNKT